VLGALTGCTPVPANLSASVPHHVMVNYTPQVLDPSNCGTPDDYKLCIIAPGPRPVIPGEPIPDLTPPPEDWNEEITVPVPSPPLPPDGV